MTGYFKLSSSNIRLAPESMVVNYPFLAEASQDNRSVRRGDWVLVELERELASQECVLQFHQGHPNRRWLDLRTVLSSILV